ncbi:hypothetical protein KG112_17320 [Nocardioides sp. zg-ZUI104]|uniref:hypothetical protein n=1 Tax=Nocardioides faecalis TaxID=2803858 RepID=UPI001BCF3664|nr:hypothetical protein [Nocardioides faecalis]MBS4754571.1 hypothetical protein [Nocardioides faecalis]
MTNRVAGSTGTPGTPGTPGSPGTAGATDNIARCVLEQLDVPDKIAAHRLISLDAWPTAWSWAYDIAELPAVLWVDEAMVHARVPTVTEG